MKRNETLHEMYKILHQLIQEYLAENTPHSRLKEELEVCSKNCLSYSIYIRDQDYLEDYPINTSVNDVFLCPRCHDQDVLPGHRICNSCRREIFLDKNG